MSTFTLVLIIVGWIVSLTFLAFVVFVAGVFAGCWLTNRSWADDIQRKEQIEESWKKSQLREAQE